MSKIKEAVKQFEDDVDSVVKSVRESDLGKEIGDLGREIKDTVVSTVKKGVRTVTEWAQEDKPKGGNSNAPVEDGEIIDEK